jgi:CelD/BcsL family acetyltransferase involved in cellulose biosynthesis
MSKIATARPRGETRWDDDPREPGIVQSAPAPAAMELVEHEWTRLWGLHHPGLFHSFAWMRLWMSHFAEEQAVELFTVREYGVVRMIVPLRIRELQWGPFRVRMAVTIGTLHLPCNDFLYDPATVGRSFAALARHLTRERRVHLLRLVALPEESALTSVLREGPWGLRRVENVGCRNRRAVIDEDFQTYFQTRSAKLRTEIRHDSRRLAGLGRLSTRWHTHLDGNPNILDDYFGLYARSWQERERREAFFRDSLRLLSRLGKLRLFFLEIDENLVAAQVLAVDHETAYNLKNFFDARLGKYSPGTVLCRDAFQRTIDGDHVKAIDYMKGDQGYKARWAPLVRRRFDWTVSLGPTGTAALSVKRLIDRAPSRSRPHG